MPFYKVDESAAIFGKTMKEAYNEAQKQDRFYNKWSRVLNQPLGSIIKIRIHTDRYCMARHRVGAFSGIQQSPFTRPKPAKTWREQKREYRTMTTM